MRPVQREGADVWAPSPYVDTGHLDALVDEAVPSPRLVTITGAPGLGKSRTVSEASARLSGSVVLLGRCHQMPHPFPLGPIVDALRRIPRPLKEIDSPAAGALRPLIPELADALPAMPEGADTDREWLRHLQFRGVTDLLGALGPTVLVIEDVHWIDPLSLSLVGYLLEEMPPGLQVWLTYRPDELATAVPAMVSRAGSRMPVTRVELGPWGAETAGALAAAMLDVEWVSEEFAEHLSLRSAGIPLAVQELMRLMVERGSVTRRDGEWIRLVTSQLDVPTGVRDPILERVGHLDADARVVVEALSVLQVPADPETIADVAGLPLERCSLALEQADRRGLAVDHEGAFECIHRLAGQAVYDALAPVQRRGLHARAAHALAALVEPPLDQIAAHHRSAGHAEEWVEAAVAAAARARSEGRDEAVVDALLPLAASSMPAGAHRYWVIEALASAAGFSSRAPEVLDLLTRLPFADLDWSPVEVATIKAKVTALLGNTSGEAGRIREFASSVIGVDDVADETRLGVLASITSHYPGHGSRADLLAIVDDVAGRFRTRPSPGDYTADRITSIRAELGDPGARDEIRRRLRLAPPADRIGMVGLFNLTESACIMGDYDLADRLVATHLSSDDPRLMPAILIAVARTVRLELDFWAGRWEGLDRRLREVQETQIARAFGHHREQALLGTLSLARAGPTPDVAATLDRVLRNAARTGSLENLALAAGPRARLTTADPDGGLGWPGLALFELAIAEGMLVPTLYRALPSIVRMLLEGGQVDRAEVVMAAMSPTPATLDAPLAVAATAHTAGHRAAYARDWNEAAACYLRAAEEYQARGVCYESAQAQEEAADAVARSDRDQATTLLAAALTTYDALGAAWDVDRARGLGRLHGLSLPSRHRVGRRGYGAQLSPRERDVADLAAAGHTNREIADQLYLSVNTVNRHISAALRKLDLRSRRELPGALARVGAAGSD